MCLPHSINGCYDRQWQYRIMDGTNSGTQTYDYAAPTPAVRVACHDGERSKLANNANVSSDWFIGIGRDQTLTCYFWHVHIILHNANSANGVP
jgi:hypothetical protein